MSPTNVERRMDPTMKAGRSTYSWRDWCGAALHVVLSALGVHMVLAVGFTVTLGADLVVTWRHPVLGAVVIVLGFVARYLASPSFRRAAEKRGHIDLDAIRRFAVDDDHVPWRPALTWVMLAAFIVYLANDRYVGTGDTKPMLPVAYSIVHDGDLTLDEFVDTVNPPYYVARINDHFYSLYSLGPAFFAVPFVVVAELLGADLTAHDHLWRLDTVVSALAASATVAFVFLTLLRLTRPRVAALLTVFFALGSQNWSISSQALWQHGPVALCSSIVLFIECRRPERHSVLETALQGALLGFAVACRPTAVVLLAALSAFVLWRRPKRLPALAVGAVVAGAPFLFAHVSVYGSIFGPYARASAADAWNLALGPGLAGNLFSPARGLLVYQPVVLLAAAACFLRTTRGLGRPLAVTLSAWCAVHVLIVSAFRMWWGGHCWGPRFMTELMPALTVLCVPALERLWSWATARVALSALVGWSVLLQAIGTLDPKAHQWQLDAVGVGQTPRRLWDWSDPPFLCWLRPPQDHDVGVPASDPE